MEPGTHSIWISEQLQELGHEVIVANVRELRAISHSDRKSDEVDAEKLARYARLDPEILRPISHRTVEQQEALTLIRARDLMVRLRTAAVNAVRGLTKSCGQALGPVLEQIAAMTIKIKLYDRSDPAARSDKLSGDTSAAEGTQYRRSYGADVRADLRQ